MKPFEVQPCLDVGGLVGLSLRSNVPIEKKLADALIRLGSCSSSHWETAMKLSQEQAVCVEVSLEQLALLMERPDFSSGRAAGIEGMVFWPYAYAAMEFLKALGYEWTNQLGFDCHG